MKFVPRLALFLGVMIALVPALYAGKKLSKADKKWLEQDVAALITEDERELFVGLESDEEREIFKEIFWTRRDPSPTTPFNELRNDYEARLFRVNRDLKVPGRAGAETDMGRIILLLGAPSRSGSGPSSDRTEPDDALESPLDDEAYRPAILGGNADAPGGSIADDMTSEEAVQTWVYGPNEVLGLPEGLRLRFRAQPSFGYRLIRSKDVDQALERVKRARIANPDIEYGRDRNGRLVMAAPGSEAAPSLVEEILFGLRDGGVTSSDVPFEVKPAFFRAGEGDIYVPVLFEIDGLSLSWESMQAPATVIGMIEDEHGNPLFQFEESVTLVRDSNRYVAFEMPLQLEPGYYNLYLGVRDDRSSKLGTRVDTIRVPALDGPELELSTVLLFSEGEKAEDPLGDVGRAFIIGGYRFTPMLDPIYEKTGRISGVYNAYGYGVMDGKPNLTAQYIFLQDGVKKGQTQDEPFISMSEESAITVFDMPLAALDPGDYTLRIQVTDHVKNETVTHDIDFILH